MERPDLACLGFAHLLILQHYQISRLLFLGQEDYLAQSRQEHSLISLRPERKALPLVSHRARAQSGKGDVRVRVGAGDGDVDRGGLLVRT